MNRVFSFFLFFVISCGMHIFLFTGLYSLYSVVEIGNKVPSSVGSRLVIEFQCFERKFDEFHEKKEDTLKVEKLRKIEQNRKIQLNNNMSSQLSGDLRISSDKGVSFKNNYIPKKGDGRFYSSNIPIIRINPMYPIKAKLLKIEGKVIVRYDINIRGKVENISILHSAPPHIFDDSVRLAMLHWIYKKGHPRNRMIVTFKFNLRDIEKLRK